ncbi:MAG: squalene--hopene cyclase [Candidatus Hydrogenedentota bacterium]|nr:MAG: squalene--hopene cyclase [Candidatus Hydrogenedentota bacterium]
MIVVNAGAIRRSSGEGSGEIDPAKAVERAVEVLLKLQSREGYWAGELFADATLAADTVILYSFLGMNPIPRSEEYRRHILSRQLSDGGWNIYPGGPAEINATLKAYTALKLIGLSKDEPCLVKAREAIRGLGGLRGIHTYCRFYLAALGQIPWSKVPDIPPEIMLLPKSLPIGLHGLSSWTRVIVVPMMIIRALEPVAKVPAERGVGELIEEFWAEKPPPRSRWGRFFLFLDGILRLYGKIPFNPIRSVALKKAEEWMRRHLVEGGLGAIYPAIQNSIMALKTLGFDLDSPLLRDQLKEIEGLHVFEGGEVRVQPCTSHVWDTAWSLTALAEAGFTLSHPALRRGVVWLLSKKLPAPTARNERGETMAAWSFEYQNPFFPDIDDTAAVLMALTLAGARTDAELGSRARAAIEEGTRWIRWMRNRDGGWASFDKDVDCRILEHVPFADHNAILDPSTADITARVLECFSVTGVSITEEERRGAVAFLLRNQEPNGSWFGRWGVNYIYGTSAVLVALSAYQGDSEVKRAVENGARWLKSVQNEDGGWGESCSSYEEPGVYQAIESTPSQTAWAVIGLIAAGYGRGRAVKRGVGFLCRSQKSDGTWDEHVFTGTGFPRVFYLGYSMYSHNFPIIALARYRRLNRIKTTVS